jgi:hypothetical protein
MLNSKDKKSNQKQSHEMIIIKTRTTLEETPVAKDHKQSEQFSALPPIQNLAIKDRHPSSSSSLNGL